ncbi:MAG: hypothetical protein KA325_02250 [Flavobacterium sp.]|nr:hypothetical protein [Flavobacterium sp.]
MNPFTNRTVVLATQHQKEQVMAPLLTQALQVTCVLAPDLNTDQWGTFSGEVERKDDVLTTLRKKCQHAMMLSQCDLAVASEGSFGAHPSIFFAQADDEVIMLLDAKNGYEIVAREISTDTNFNGQYVDNEEELFVFAKTAKFPSHGLILKSAEKNFSETVKGITIKEDLLKAYYHMAETHQKVYVETDMRALYNPTRMQVIASATSKLLDAIAVSCPQCEAPGFRVTQSIAGLECSWCNKPTQSTRMHVMGCIKCEHTALHEFPYQKTTEDPMYCDFCNP